MTPADHNNPTPNGIILLIKTGFLVMLTVTIFWPLLAASILVLVVLGTTVAAVVKHFQK